MRSKINIIGLTLSLRTVWYAYEAMVIYKIQECKKNAGKTDIFYDSTIQWSI